MGVIFLEMKVFYVAEKFESSIWDPDIKVIPEKKDNIYTDKHLTNGSG